MFKHYGREVIASILQLPSSHPDIEIVFLKVYKSFMEAIDAIDNGVCMTCKLLFVAVLLQGILKCRSIKRVPAGAGINQYDTDQPPRYVSSTDLSARVGGLNPRWNNDASAAATDEGFARAVELTGREFEDAVEYYSKVRLCKLCHVGSEHNGGKASALAVTAKLFWQSLWLSSTVSAISVAGRDL